MIDVKFDVCVFSKSTSKYLKRFIKFTIEEQLMIEAEKVLINSHKFHLEQYFAIKFFAQIRIYN